MVWRVAMEGIDSRDSVLNWSLEELFTAIYMLDRKIIDEYIQSKAME